MSNTFMKVDEVAAELGVSKSYAYKIVQKLNEEMKKMGYLTISGRVNKQYFMKKTCYNDTKKKECDEHASL
ncbi:MAG: DNA-binding protein [Acetivibrionales bacterium]|jgi:predicted transcriptional regulator|nr:helix-turn-helix domain-containing protein [Clostridiales bacterium]